MQTKANQPLPSRILFLGAGGIGMANLVRFALSRGIQVAGYDRTPSALTDRLQEEGAELVFDDDPALIPQGFGNPDDAMLVYTPAVPQSNRIFTELRARGFRPVKRAALLGMLTAPTKAICVAGSHGKTTTSSMIAHILYGSAIGCDAFLGGILRNYDSNLLLTPGSDYSVVEADEYDRSFLQLRPWTAIVTSTDPDHLDIYGDEASYLEAFSDFTALIRPGGNLIVHTGLKFRPRTGPEISTFTYSAQAPADYHAENVRFEPGKLLFDIVGPSLQVRQISLGVPVEINVDNAVAAAAAASLAGASAEEIKRGLETFLGPKRRFEFWLKGDEPGAHGRVLIDDYAHSPNEVAASIASVRRLYPGRKITVIFQPHLYTRTRDFAPEFARALSAADDVVLTEIYPARELPIEGVTSDLIFEAVESPAKTLICRKDLLDLLKNRNFEILMTLGAADLDRLLPDIREIMISRKD